MSNFSKLQLKKSAAFNNEIHSMHIHKLGRWQFRLCGATHVGWGCNSAVTTIGGNIQQQYLILQLISEYGYPILKSHCFQRADVDLSWSLVHSWKILKICSLPRFCTKALNLTNLRPVRKYFGRVFCKSAQHGKIEIWSSIWWFQMSDVVFTFTEDITTDAITVQTSYVWTDMCATEVWSRLGYVSERQ